MNRFLLLLSALLLSLGACKKEKDPLDTLPEATQTGANTVGWLQDGKAYQPTNDGFNSRAIIVSRFSNGDADIYFKHNQGDLNRSIILFVRQLRQPGVYRFNQVARPNFPRTTPAYGYFDTYTPEPTSEYLTSPTATGQLTVTRFDSVAQIISGTFEFTARRVRGEGPDSVRITEGRFDLRYPQ